MGSTRTDEKEKERERMEKYTSSTPPLFFLHSFLALSLFVSLSLSLENVCWVWNDPREGRQWEGDSKGNSIEPTYSSPFLHLLSFPLFPLLFLALRCQRCSNTLLLCLHHHLVRQKNNLSPSTLVSSLVPSLSQCAGKKIWGKLPVNERELGRVASKWPCFKESSVKT